MASRRREWGGMVFSTDANLQSELERGYSEEVETLPSEQQRLVVQRDTKQRRGKVVTLVTGFVGTSEDLGALGKRLKTACGVGGSAKDGEIVVQGDLVERVHSLLLEWGYKLTKRR